MENFYIRCQVIPGPFIFLDSEREDGYEFVRHQLVNWIRGGAFTKQCQLESV